jgi:hypothetical protein
MSHQIQRIIQIAASLDLMVGVAARSDASIALTTPAGLTPGEQFRFVFVTDGTTTATSTTIGDYDSFVQSQAGGATYNGITVSWLAIGTTDSVNAIDHIGQTNTPVYLADGSLVTTSTTTSGLWSGSLLHAIDEDLNMTPVNAAVWTGTGQGGTATSSFTPLGVDVTLGGSFGSTLIGESAASDSTWIDAKTAVPQSGIENLYGISQVLTVPGATTAVPEPSTALVAVFGAVAFVAYGWCRHRRAERRRADA